jgi:hypothetical protein
VKLRLIDAMSVSYDLPGLTSEGHLMQDKKFLKKLIWLFPFAAVGLLSGGDCEFFDFFDDDDDDDFDDIFDDDDKVISQAIPLFTDYSV